MQEAFLASLLHAKTPHLSVGFSAPAAAAAGCPGFWLQLHRGKDGTCRHYSRPIEREKTSEQPALTSLACWGFVLTCGLCDNISC